jgi:molecular chaperone GrpE
LILAEQNMASKEQSEHIDQNSVMAAEEPDAGATPSDSAAETEELKFNVDELQQELEEARAKSEDNWNKLLRTQAELENHRKRSRREIENAHKYAIEKFAAELLPVKDSLELGLTHTGEQADAQKLHEGMALTLKMLSQVMEKFNIEEVNPQGQPFDPERHQAMTVQENAELEPNSVISVMQKGYVLNGRLLRPAMVIVSKKPNQ